MSEKSLEMHRVIITWSSSCPAPWIFALSSLHKISQILQIFGIHQWDVIKDDSNVSSISFSPLQPTAALMKHQCWPSGQGLSRSHDRDELGFTGFIFMRDKEAHFQNFPFCPETDRVTHTSPLSSLQPNAVGGRVCGGDRVPQQTWSPCDICICWKKSDTDRHDSEERTAP